MGLSVSRKKTVSGAELSGRPLCRLWGGSFASACFKMPIVRCVMSFRVCEYTFNDFIHQKWLLRLNMTFDLVKDKL